MIFPALVWTIIYAIRDKSTPLLGVWLLIVLYLILLFITLRPSLGSTVRSWSLVMLAYVAGVVTMMRGGLAGSGRIYFLSVSVMAVTLISGQMGIYFGLLAMVTYTVFGILAQAGLLEMFLITKINPLDASYWFYEGLTMATMFVATIFLNMKFANFQLKTLHSVQKITSERITSKW